MPIFDKITLLVTHYNRSKSLEKLLISLKHLSLNFKEIIVSDDGSKDEHLDFIDILKQNHNFKLITTPKNKGLGNNINKGQDKVTTPYTLYIQEDFSPNAGFKEKLVIAQKFLDNKHNLDFVRFYAYFDFPHLKKVSDGFSEMKFNHSFIWQGYKKFYFYSDHPHLRRSNFLERFGRYPEGLNPDRTEYKMMLQVLAAKPKAYFYEPINELLTQENSELEPSTVRRNFWRNTQSTPIVLVRHIYRYLRFNAELLKFKIKK